MTDHDARVAEIRQRLTRVYYTGLDLQADADIQWLLAAYDAARKTVTELDAVIAEHWYGHKRLTPWRLDDQAQPVKGALERHAAALAERGEETPHE